MRPGTLTFSLSILTASLTASLVAAQSAGAADSTPSGLFASTDHTRLAARDAADGLSKDALFDLGPADSAKAAAQPPDGKDALFSLEPADKPAAAARSAPTPSQAPLPESKDALFLDAPEKPKPQAQETGKTRGYLQTELARSYATRDRWSKVMGRLELGTQGILDQGAKWKLSGRVDYNAAYDLWNDYSDAVRDDQRAQFQLRETYLDFSGGGLDWRIGRQHIVWGEMVGLFFADVVSAKDLREFVLPDFQVLRIPQWAARAEYFADDYHVEAVWIPFPSYDEIGKPADSLTRLGSDFYPYPLPVPKLYQSEDTPNARLDHGNFGLRVSQLKNGWDLSGFYYTSMNSAPTFYQFTPGTLTPRHDRIWQLGGALAKDFGSVVLKAEAAYTQGRRYTLVNPGSDADGVVKQNNLDWAVGLDFNPGSDTRMNTQFYQRYFFDHSDNIIPDRAESGITLLVNHALWDKWSVEALLVHSLNRSDWMFRPKAMWGFQPNWKLTFGVDVFHGPITGLFGQYDQQDRAYAEVRYDF